jgi:hypothetical protein
MKTNQFFIITSLLRLLVVFLIVPIVVSCLLYNKAKGQNANKTKADNSKVKAGVKVLSSHSKSSATPSCCKGAPSRLKLCLKSNKRM